MTWARPRISAGGRIDYLPPSQAVHARRQLDRQLAYANNAVDYAGQTGRALQSSPRPPGSLGQRVDPITGNRTTYYPDGAKTTTPTGRTLFQPNTKTALNLRQPSEYRPPLTTQPAPPQPRTPIRTAPRPRLSIPKPTGGAAISGATTGAVSAVMTGALMKAGGASWGESIGASVGAGIGTVAGGAAGLAVGTAIGGPIGGAIGAQVGAALGGVGGAALGGWLGGLLDSPADIPIGAITQPTGNVPIDFSQGFNAEPYGGIQVRFYSPNNGRFLTKDVLSYQIEQRYNSKGEPYDFPTFFSYSCSGDGPGNSGLIDVSTLQIVASGVCFPPPQPLPEGTPDRPARAAILAPVASAGAPSLIPDPVVPRQVGPLPVVQPIPKPDQGQQNRVPPPVMQPVPSNGAKPLSPPVAIALRKMVTNGTEPNHQQSVQPHDPTALRPAGFRR